MNRLTQYFFLIGGLLLLLPVTASFAGGLVNPSFESDLTGWTGWPTPASCTVETTTSAHEGAKTAKIAFKNAANHLIQDITSPATTLIPGHFYTLSAWYQYRVDVKTDYPGMSLNYYNSSWTLAGEYYTAGGHQGDSTNWNTIKITFKAQDHPYLRIGLSGGASNGGSVKTQGVAWFDDVSFQELAASPQQLDIYLLMGQSNMVGMDKNFLDEDQAPNPHVFKFSQNNEWVLATDPLHGVGVGPGLTFGKAMASHSATTNIGLIPLAVGSSPISDWVKGGPNYDIAINKAQLARPDGTIKGILWLQGENDSYDRDLASIYPDELAGMIRDLRQELNLPALPFVCAQIGQFLTSAYAPQINAALLDLPNQVSRTSTVVSDGLTNLDQWHFTAPSARILGQRYAAAMITLQEKPTRAGSWQLY